MKSRKFTNKLQIQKYEKTNKAPCATVTKAESLPNRCQLLRRTYIAGKIRLCLFRVLVSSYTIVQLYIQAFPLSASLPFQLLGPYSIGTKVSNFSHCKKNCNCKPKIHQSIEQGP